MPVLGIDVSHYQGEVDWHRVAASDFRFAYMKASEGGTFVDPAFARNWDGARDAALPRGAYHFAHPGSDPEAQAAHFASIVGPPTWGELPPVLDLETTDGLPPDAVVRWTLAFVDRAEALFGQRVMLYTGGLWRNQLGNPVVAELQPRLLWTARYSRQEPVVPRTWQRWDFWQFSDGLNGEVIRVPGVRGRCDINRFRGDIDELGTLISTAGATPEPAPPQPTPVTDGARAWPGVHFIWPHQPPIRSEHVRTWQVRMRDRGFAIEADGIYGPESKICCVAFQREAGLMPDGIVGRRTWDATFDP